jgi:succinoglycan biosynthesis transport protein ExoP
MDETTIDLKDLLKIVKKRKRLIISIFLTTVIAATILSFLIPKVYQGETTLRVKQSKGLGESLLASLPTGNPMATKQQMSTYAEIMKSRSVIEAVIEKVYPGIPQEKKPKFEELLKKITTTPVRDTELLTIDVQAQQPEEAQRLANTLVATFLDRITYLSRSEQKVVREFIGARLHDAKAEMEKDETVLEQYKTRQKMVAPDEETKALVERMSQIQKLAAENEVNLATSQARLANIKLQVGKEKVGFIAENKLIEQYKSKLAEQEVDLVGLLQKYTENHPEVKALRAGIAMTRQRLNQESARIINNEASSLNPIHQNLIQGKIQNEAELAAAAAQKTALTAIAADDERILTAIPTKEQGLVRLTRDASLAQEIYIMLAKRYEEAQISEVMQPTDVQVIDTAVLPDKPIKPNKTMNVMIAAFLGLFVGTGLAFALEYLNKTINTADDVKQYLDLPVLGNIPDFGSEDAQPKNLWARLKRKG